MRIIQSDNPRPLNLFAVGPGGLVAAATSTSGVPANVEVWDATTGARRFVYRAPQRECVSLLFDPAGRRLFVSEEESVSAIDVSTWAVTRGLLKPDFFAQVALSPDGSRLLVTPAVDPRGTIACYWFDGGAVYGKFWAAGPDTAHYQLPAFRGDGAQFAVTAHDLTGDRAKPALQLRDATTGKVLVSIPTDAASPVRQLAFTADGAKLLVRTDGRTVQLFDATTGAAAGELVHPGRPYVTGVAVHPRGPVACARTNGTVTFWDADTRAQLRTFDWKAGRLVSVAFSPDGALAAAGTEDGKIVVWDVDV